MRPLKNSLSLRAVVNRPHMKVAHCLSKMLIVSKALNLGFQIVDPLNQIPHEAQSVDSDSQVLSEVMEMAENSRMLVNKVRKRQA